MKTDVSNIDIPTLEDMLVAHERIKPHVHRTPVLTSSFLNELTGADLFFKCENFQKAGAFKVRGGLNFMTKLKAAQPDCPGIITATRGNHGQSVALAASKVGLTATVLVPHGNNPEKNAAMEAFGCELIVHGDDFQEAREYAAGLAEEKGLHMIPPFHPEPAPVAALTRGLRQKFDPRGILNTGLMG